MDGNAIYGRLHDLRQLAGIVAAKLQDARPGTVLRIQEDFAEGCEYCLVLDVREGGFDPAVKRSIDPLKTRGAVSEVTSGLAAVVNGSRYTQSLRQQRESRVPGIR
jgi:hypothetical protein